MSACTTQRKNFPQAKLDSKINACFLLNENGALLLRWLKTVSSTFQDVDFDRSLLPLFISWCYNHGNKKLYVNFFEFGIVSRFNLNAIAGINSTELVNELTNWRQFFYASVLIDHEFRHHIVKVAVDPRGDSRVDPQTTLTMLWRNSWSITGQTHKKTDVNLFFTITNCRIAGSRSLTRRMNFKFMCLSAYWQ